MKKLFILLIISFICSLSLYSQRRDIIWDLTKYVNPFIGTGGHGHTYPGVSLPFGMIQLSPDTRLEGWDGCSGYHYSDSIIYGFSHTHLSGTGCEDYCDILLMPTIGNIKLSNKDYSSLFKHSNEFSEAGYYSVFLDKPKVKVELTSSKRTGFHKYTFPKSEKSNIILDLTHRNEVIESSIQIIGNNEIRGLRRSKQWAQNKYVYFVIRFNKPFESCGIAVNDKILSEVNEANNKSLKAYVTFNTKNNESIIVKVGLSAVSVEGAIKNLETEIPGWDFEAVRGIAKTEWNKELNKIIVEGGSEEQKTVFYTALYHSLLVPNIYMDVDGNYRGRDIKIHKTDDFDYYTVFSLWDTFRAEHPLFTIIDQKRTNDFINTFLKQFEQGKLLPVWELSSNETFCMIGYHSIPVIVDAYVKGIRNYNIIAALKAMMASADASRYGLDSYKKLGYVSQDKEHESVSKTLEYAYDDWCISQYAKNLYYESDVHYYRFNERAQYYKNLFDPSTGFMRAKINGGWYSPFEPTEVNNNYTEANAWQYSFFVPQDISGLAKLQGGKNFLSGKLDELFTTDSKMSGRDQSDITGLIGQYAHGNEPSHHIAYLYNYLNQSWKTQNIIHKIQTEFYKNDPDGLIGNEDCGQMSAWFVLSAMGFYSVCPGQPQYAIGTPLFEKVTINLENGKQFIIKSENLSSKNYYIQSANLNGIQYNKCFINHTDIMNGGEIVFKMGEEPNKNWGSSEEDVPVTIITEDLIVPVPIIISEKKSFSNSQLIEMKTVNTTDAIYYTLDGTDPDFTSSKYSQPFLIDKAITIKAVAYNSNLRNSKIVSAEFFKIPDGRSIRILSNYSKQYTGGGDEALIDLVKGDRNWRLGSWQGYLGVDFEAIVDLGKIQMINKISAEFLQDVMSWICFPTEIKFEISSDGINFSEAGTINTNMNVNERGLFIKDFGINITTKARYIKVKAKNFGKMPDWHPGKSDPAWLFIDEITIE